jgi:hypothetical protein
LQKNKVLINVQSRVQYLLTFGFFSSIIARLGDTKIDSPYATDIPVSEFIKHEESDRFTKQNDIALAKLSWNVKFTDLIQPACLWQSSQLDDKTVQAIGWGKYSNDFDDTSNDLLKVFVDIFDNRRCVDAFDSDDSIVINEKQICAGSSTGEKDTCGGGEVQLRAKNF